MLLSSWAQPIKQDPHHRFVRFDQWLLQHFCFHNLTQEPHISVHFKLCFLHEQLKVVQLPLQPHFTSSRTALGAGGRVVGIACSRSTSWLNPWDVGAGRSGCGEPHSLHTFDHLLKSSLRWWQLFICILLLAEQKPTQFLYGCNMDWWQVQPRVVQYTRIESSRLW